MAPSRTLQDARLGAGTAGPEEAEVVCKVSLFCVKNTKNKKQMFIFYFSFTLYKLFDNCQRETVGILGESLFL